MANSSVLKGYIVHSVAQRDVPWVYQYGKLVQEMGYQPEYWFEHQGQQMAFELVEKSNFVLGLAISMHNLNTVLQLYQYAERLGKKALLVAEKGIRLPPRLARSANVHVFRKQQPQNPVRFVQMQISRW